MTRRTGLPAWWPQALMFAGALTIGSGLAVREHDGPWWITLLLVFAGAVMAVPELRGLVRDMARLRRLNRGLYCSACLDASADLSANGHGWLCADEAACLARCARKRRGDVL